MADRGFAPDSGRPDQRRRRDGLDYGPRAETLASLQSTTQAPPNIEGQAMGRWWIWALAALAIANGAWAAPVRTTAGLVEGTSEDGLSVYRGVPFAAPPVGDRRWRPPASAAPWQGIRKADRFAAPCMGNGPGSSEDCLYLNIWSPAKPGEHLPVMVWIYGGGFTN